MIYTRYASRTGKILGTMDIPDQESYDLHSTLLIEGSNDTNEVYVKDGVITERPEMEISVSRLMVSIANEEFVSITGIPFGSDLTISHPELGYVSQRINATDYLYKPKAPGKFTFTFSCFPYKDATFDVTAYSLEL